MGFQARTLSSDEGSATCNHPSGNRTPQRPLIAASPKPRQSRAWWPKASMNCRARAAAPPCGSCSRCCASRCWRCCSPAVWSICCSAVWKRRWSCWPSRCLSVGITVVQEARTERVLEALRDLTSPRALVIRGGERLRIAGREVVRGDLIVLAEGDRVPADAVLIEATGALCRRIPADGRGRSGAQEGGNARSRHPSGRRRSAAWSSRAA